MYLRPEKFLLDKFEQMPGGVRIFTYLAILFLFLYLSLMPKFINGRTKISYPNGGERPFRGAAIKMSIDGRNYKFYSNEEGCWSIPVISKLPSKVSVLFHYPDTDQWFPLEFDITEVWSHTLFVKDFVIEVSDNPPSFKIVSYINFSAFKEVLVSNAMRILDFFETRACAGELKLSREIIRNGISPTESRTIEKTILSIIKIITGKTVQKSFSLIGNRSLRYIQRIEIIEQIETKYNLKIPDEHWKNFGTVGALTDYVKKRIILVRYLKRRNISDSPNYWNLVNQIPVKIRPKFELNKQ